MAMTRQEWTLAAVAILVTTALLLLLLRWLAPGLLGIPVDLQLVQASRTLPPFYSGVFRDEDADTTDFILQDPHTNTRLRPLLAAGDGSGPHDLLGFRNLAVPNSVDIVVIGDSQTYGIGEPLTANWPSQLQALLADTSTGVYSMATGGWGAVQYLYMADKAARLRPRVLVVAFYSGNDPLESFATAYGNPHWRDLRPDPGLEADDAPRVASTLSADDAWLVTTGDGLKLAFSPQARLDVNNRDAAAVRAGYAIMAEAARRIHAQSAAAGIDTVFTTIPTRELVYASYVETQQLDAPPAYRQLVAMEQANIEELEAQISALPGARYVDVVAPLQAAALAGQPLYPRAWDGHPGKDGHAVIAATLASALNER